MTEFTTTSLVPKPTIVWLLTKLVFVPTMSTVVALPATKVFGETVEIGGKVAQQRGRVSLIGRRLSDGERKGNHESCDDSETST